MSSPLTRWTRKTPLPALATSLCGRHGPDVGVHAVDDAHHRDDGHYPDDVAEERQDRAQLVRPESLEGDQDSFDEVHRGSVGDKSNMSPPTSALYGSNPPR